MPALTAKAGVKTWNAWIIWSTRLKKSTGESIGMVMERNCRHQEAPSTAAASYSSTGIC